MTKETTLFISLFSIAVAVLVILAFLTGRKAWREMEADEKKKTNYNNNGKREKSSV